MTRNDSLTERDPERFDPSRIDLDAFARDVRAMRQEVDASLGPEDVAHLRKTERIGRLLTAIGLVTAPFFPNPISAACLAAGKTTRWALMHHIGHRGYDRVPGVPKKYTSKVFARGRRRWLDWNDWMFAEAWTYEHNVLHHSYTGEPQDPDLLERNVEGFHGRVHSPMKRALAVAFFSITWKPLYYTPNTVRTWTHRHEGASEQPNELPLPKKTLFLRCLLPYALLNFIILPILFLPLGLWAAGCVLLNMVMAEFLTNLHTFAIVGPNHSGDDLYRFEGRPKTRGEYYLRQVIGSVNYHTGSDLVDFPQMWLNYQIEHHVWPDLPMRQYRLIQPRFKALCEKHGVPYLQEGLESRLRKFADILLGKTKMRSLA